MKTENWMILAAVAMATFLVLRYRAAGAVGGPQEPAQHIMGTLTGQTITLASGHVLDISGGVIFDPMTGRYTNVHTGEVIYG